VELGYFTFVLSFDLRGKSMCDVKNIVISIKK
jgi:hypothetical protein